METKMTNKELREFFAALKVAETLKGKSENIVKFLYAVNKNINNLKDEIESMNKGKAPLPSYIEYDRERIELAKTHAEKNKKGKPIIITHNGRQTYDIFIRDEEGEYMFDENGQRIYKTEFTEALKELKEKHKATFEERMEQLKKYDELLKEEVTIDIYKVPLGFLPSDCVDKDVENDGITVNSSLFKLLLPMVVEE